MSGVQIFFTCTSLFALVFPLAKLAPFWLEARRVKQLAFHQGRIAEIDAALAQTPDAALSRRRDRHRAAVAALERRAA